MQHTTNKPAIKLSTRVQILYRGLKLLPANLKLPNRRMNAQNGLSSADRATESATGKTAVLQYGEHGGDASWGV